jgi:hypothetical protein
MGWLDMIEAMRDGLHGMTRPAHGDRPEWICKRSSSVGFSLTSGRTNSDEESLNAAYAAMGTGTGGAKQSSGIETKGAGP